MVVALRTSYSLICLITDDSLMSCALPKPLQSVPSLASPSLMGRLPSGNHTQPLSTHLLKTSRLFLMSMFFLACLGMISHRKVVIYKLFFLFHAVDLE